MGVDIALIDVDLRIGRDWLGNVPKRIVVAVERFVRRQRQPADCLRRGEPAAVLE